MKRLVLALVICLGCFGFLEAQDNIWKPVNGTGILGAGPDGSIFAYNENGKLARSQDEGETWQIVLGQETGFTGFINSSCFAVSNEGRIFVFNDNQQTVVYSDDAGDTWQQTTVISLCGMPTKAGICAPTNDIFVVWAENGEIDFTLDGGETWNYSSLASWTEEPWINDLIVNEAGDVYISMSAGGCLSGGIIHSTLNDGLENWTSAAFSFTSIFHLEFDPEGNVIAGSNWDPSMPIPQEPGFYLLPETCEFVVADNGIIYCMRTEYHSAVLAYSTDHGEHFTEIGEHVPLVDIAPGGENPHLFKGYDNYLYFDGGGEYWKSVRNADEIPTYSPLIGTRFFDEASRLYYIITSVNPRRVSVAGHVDGENAQGELDIPSEVTYEDVTYTVTEIGEWAFKNCTGLTGQLYFPSTIDTIREGAFYGCSGFTGTLDLSFSTVAFKENVFRDCTGFTDLILPLFISEIPQGLFCGCSGLMGTLVLPETVEIIGEYAFAQCSGFTGLVLPNCLREIREQAFSGCIGFTGNLVLPETVTHIKYGAFHDCSGFSGDLVLPNSVVEVGHTTNPIFNNMPLPDLYTSAFADCFDHLVLSQSLETIGMYCFAGCTRLTGDLVMPSGLKAIKDYAFAGCTGFNSLTLNDSLLLIGRDAFMACNGITGTLTIPENISLGLGAFEMCEGIEELDLPHNITFVDSENIKGGVFYRCTGLTEVDIPEGWIKIEQSTFAYCSNLRRVHLPESLISIEDGAFLECTNLEEINIPEGVTGIKDASFALCRSLTHIELPSTLRTLGSAFQRCTSLTGDMVIPDLVQKVNAYTFDSCNMLNRIVLGDSVNWISEPAFDYTELSSLVLKTMSPPQLWRHESPNAWHLPVDIPIIVPCGALEAYQNDENWSGFTNITEDCGSGMTTFNGSEWYYEILNEDGSITYQHLQQSADTTVNDKTVTVIIRTNTLYDKGRHQEVTREYIYEEDNVVYWWNNELMEFTVLYDLGAQQGDSWVIKVGTETLTMYVDAVEQYYYDGRLFKMLVVSDEQDLFSGIIVCGIGHLTSFFPERLMTRGEKYRVEGIRCYWHEGELVFKYGDRDCDEVYEQYHFGIEEDGPSTGSGTLTVYPNPTDGVLFVETRSIASLASQTYRVTNLTGQTVLTGGLNAETQQIDVSGLPQGMYFITFAGETKKFVVNK